MHIATANHPIPADKAGIGAALLAWFGRAFDRLADQYDDVDPIALRVLPPF